MDNLQYIVVSITVPVEKNDDCRIATIYDISGAQEGASSEADAGEVVVQAGGAEISTRFVVTSPGPSPRDIARPALPQTSIP